MADIYCIIPHFLAYKGLKSTNSVRISPAVEEVYLAPEYICHFFLYSLSTDSSDFKSAGCQVGKFGQFDI